LTDSAIPIPGDFVIVFTYNKKVFGCLVWQNRDAIATSDFKKGYIFLTCPVGFWIPIISSNLNFSCSNILHLKILLEKDKKKQFCFKICTDLSLWEKIVLVIEKIIWNSRMKVENLQKICWVVGQNKIPFLTFNFLNSLIKNIRILQPVPLLSYQRGCVEHFYQVNILIRIQETTSCYRQHGSPPFFATKQDIERKKFCDFELSSKKKTWY
jgi:hypothetical protein